LAVLILIFGCDSLSFLNPKKPQIVKERPRIAVSGKVIARVDDIPITLEELNQDITDFNETVPQDKPEQKITTKEQKVEFVRERLVRRALLYEEALRRGLDSSADVVQALERTKMDLLVVKLVKEETDKVEVTSKEIEDAYNTYKDQLREPEERQIREIVVSSEQDAKDVLVQLLQGADFATLAKERSKAASSKQGGDLGFISKGDKFAQFDEVAFSNMLDVGKTSNIFKGPQGYYILKLEAKRGGKQKTLSELWDDIKRTLTFLKQQQKLEELVNNVSKTAKININEGEIK